MSGRIDRYLILTAVIFVSVVKSNDLRIGYTQGDSRKIFSELREASPALWTRTDDVVVNVTGRDVISAVYVTDLRDDKDGIANLESGGIGERSVTIGLKSPTVLRGYKFLIEVYASDPNARFYSKGPREYDPYEQQQQQYGIKH